MGAWQLPNKLELHFRSVGKNEMLAHTSGRSLDILYACLMGMSSVTARENIFQMQETDHFQACLRFFRSLAARMVFCTSG